MGTGRYIEYVRRLFIVQSYFHFLLKLITFIFQLNSYEYKEAFLYPQRLSGQAGGGTLSDSLDKPGGVDHRCRPFFPPPVCACLRFYRA